MENLSIGYTHTPIQIQTRKLEKLKTTLLGLAFIMATVTAIIGAKLYDPILVGENYLEAGATHSKQIVLGAFFEMLLVCANSITAILMYPYLKRFSQRLAIAYICFLLLEVVFIVMGIVSVLALLSISQFYLQHPADIDTFRVVGTALKAIQHWIFILGPHFMLGINTFIYSYVFYRSRLVPRPLSIWGITGAILVFLVAILKMFEIVEPSATRAIIMVIPIALYEMVLAGWLIANGFNLKNQSA